ncbi:MAG: polyprenyl synthetase family protein [Actinomycetota bacterium]|nr:polyprenyl synthetase family protein [Actinomycetota bacterium]
MSQAASPESHLTGSGDTSTLFGATWLVDDLIRVEDVMTAAVSSRAHPLVDEAAMHLIKAGGKRLRPALVLMTSRAGEPGRRETDLAAAAIELVHIATLYHDDVIDETQVRRGVPTVHSKWGVEVAVLAGDYLFARGCALGAEAGGEVPGILAAAIGAVCEGQIVETAALGQPLRPVDDYIDTIRQKTAALFRAACELGASTSGCGPAERTALVSYGENLGLAFQIVDDLLDVIGDPRITGKRVGSDLREGVLTMPFLLAASRDEAVRASLAGGERDLDAVLPALHATGALEESVAAAEGYADRARSALAGLAGGDWREALETVIAGVIGQVPTAPAV